MNERILELLADAEFLLRKVSINWKEAGSMTDSCARCAADLRELIAELGALAVSSKEA